jgi:hypothetical protein
MVWHEMLAGFAVLPGTVLQRNDDDCFDRINHRWTSALLIGFALIVSTTQYVGAPIHCWVPKHFTGSWEDYTNSFCWIRYLRDVCSSFQLICFFC